MSKIQQWFLNKMHLIETRQEIWEAIRYQKLSQMKEQKQRNIYKNMVVRCKALILASRSTIYHSIWYRASQKVIAAHKLRTILCAFKKVKKIESQRKMEVNN